MSGERNRVGTQVTSTCVVWPVRPRGMWVVLLAVLSLVGIASQPAMATPGSASEPAATAPAVSRFDGGLGFIATRGPHPAAATADWSARSATSALLATPAVPPVTAIASALANPYLTPMATAPAAQLVPSLPERVVDTRLDVEGPLRKGERIVLTPGDTVPAGVTAVAFNIVATGQSASGYLEVAPEGALPGSSTVNWSGPHQTIANGYITGVSAAREFQITLESTGTAHVVLDITGVFAPPGTAETTLFTGAARRIYDSRGGDGPLQPGEFRLIETNTGGAPPAVSQTAAAVNVTATGTTGPGVFSAASWPTSVTSTINWSGAAQTVANAVITDVWVDGTFVVTNNGQTAADLVVDLTGLFAPTAWGATGAQFYAMDPVRSYDSRLLGGLLLAGTSRTNAQPVPDGAAAVAVNTTITGTSGTGYISVTPPTVDVPITSTVNWYDSPTTRANGSIVPVAAASTRAYVGGNYATHYVYDVGGYFQ